MFIPESRVSTNFLLVITTYFTKDVTFYFESVYFYPIMYARPSLKNSTTNIAILTKEKTRKQTKKTRQIQKPETVVRAEPDMPLPIPMILP